MQDLPQQPPDYEVVIPIEEREGSGVNQGSVEYQVIEPPAPPLMKLKEKDLFNLAHYLSSKYEKGFTWEQLPLILEATRVFVGANPEMSLKDKRKACIEIIHYMMVSLDSLYLPEKATDPFFEELIVPFTELALSFPTDRALTKPSREDPVTDEAIEDYAKQLKLRFENEGLTWKNLSIATYYALTYILSYENLDRETRAQKAFAIMDVLLSETDLSRLPVYYDGKLFRVFLESFIKVQVSN